MSGTNIGFQGVPESSPNVPDQMRRFARAINSLLEGKMNAYTTVTLTANAATTTLTDARITSNSFVGFTPTTANAAAALASIFITNRLPAGGGNVAGTCTINHANNAQVDKSFTVLIIG